MTTRYISNKVISKIELNIPLKQRAPASAENKQQHACTHKTKPPSSTRLQETSNPSLPLPALQLVSPALWQSHQPWWSPGLAAREKKVGTLRSLSSRALISPRTFSAFARGGLKLGTTTKHTPEQSADAEGLIGTVMLVCFDSLFVLSVCDENYVVSRFNMPVLIRSTAAWRKVFSYQFLSLLISILILNPAKLPLQNSITRCPNLQSFSQAGKSKTPRHASTARRYGRTCEYVR